KTGDLVRYLPNGSIEILGRIDGQVKIRGFRIELGEIEATLSQHPAVRESIVLVRENSLNDKQLIAYLALDAEGVTDQEIRALVRQKLPEYMVPAHIMLLSTLPVLPNRKVDRKALLALELRD